MNTQILDSYFQQTSQEEQKLYDYFSDCVQQKSPSQVIDHFYCLFIEGREYDNKQVHSAMKTIVGSKQVDQRFNFVINQCCQILINHWYTQPELQPAISELLERFDNLPSAKLNSYSYSNRGRQLVKNFTDTEQYRKLKRLTRVINQNLEITTSRENNSISFSQVGNLIKRYPYLYKHCLVSEDSSYQFQRTVRTIRTGVQESFERDLSLYVTYLVRLAQLARARQLSTGVGRVIHRVPNPTLLSEYEFNIAIKLFLGKVEGDYNYRGLAQNFLNYSSEISSYKLFKEALYEYLISSIDPQYAQGKFGEQLSKKMEGIMPTYHSQKPTEFLLLRTANHILNFLVVESSQNPNHYVFLDLVNNLGATQTIGLLLKLLLLSHKIKPYLEQRLAILFSHYEYSSQELVPWLIKALENLHIALSIHCGATDLSCLKMIKGF